MTKTENQAEFAGAYALNALNPAEAAEFEQFLAGSEQARMEAEELGGTAVALGLATEPVQPSAGLKVNIMAKLASTPQLPPLAGPAELEATVTTPAGQNIPDAAPGAAEDAASGASAAATPGRPRTRSHATERARLRWFQRPAGLSVAAAAAIALFVGGAFVGQAFTTDQFEQQQAASLVQINAAPDSQRASTTTEAGQTATLVWSGELGLSALLVADLPALPADKDYQLWYINESGPEPAGTFDSAGSGTAWRVLEGTMHAGDQVGVTVEPAGGSKQPTTDPIVAFQS